MKVIRWEDPPPRERSSRVGIPVDHGKWRRIAEEMRARPGSWALLADGAPLGTIGVMATRMNRGAKPFGPGFEAVTRGVGSVREGRLYARYVGEAS